MTSSKNRLTAAIDAASLRQTRVLRFGGTLTRPIKYENDF